LRKKRKPDYLYEEETPNLVIGRVRVGRVLEQTARGGTWAVIGAVSSILTLLVSLATLIVTLLREP